MEYMVLLQSLRARNGYTEHTEKTKAGVSSVSSVVKKFIEVFFVDENALIACYERGLNENTNGLIRQALFHADLAISVCSGNLYIFEHFLHDLPA